MLTPAQQRRRDKRHFYITRAQALQAEELRARAHARATRVASRFGEGDLDFDMPPEEVRTVSPRR